MPSLQSPARLAVTFDDEHAAANAGPALVGVLCKKLGLEALAQEFASWLAYRRVGRSQCSPSRSPPRLAFSLASTPFDEPRSSIRLKHRPTSEGASKFGYVATTMDFLSRMW